MNSNNPIRNYKHDISGKFKDITSAIASMDESAFNDSSNNEIFHAVHEVLLKMVKTSRNTMIENLNQEITLVVSDKEADLNLSKLQIESLTVRYEMKDEKMKYFYFQVENKGEVKEHVATILSLLPVRSVLNEMKDQKMVKFLEEENFSIED
jgi:hypothetical protein